MFDLSRGQFDEVMKTYSRLQDNDREGYTEIFRPYARPGNDWIEETARLLALGSKPDRP